MSKISENVLKVLIQKYKSQTQDSEEQIRFNIKRFQQLGDSLAKKVNDVNPIILKIIPSNIIVNNQFKDVTKYPNYEHLLLIIQALSIKPLDPYKQAIEMYKKHHQYMDPKIIGNYVARFKLNLDELIDLVNNKEKEVIKMIPKDLLNNNLYKNITNWRSFENLEHLLDSIFPLENNGDSNLYNIDEESDLVYSNNGIKIYKGDEEFKCIKYGNGYSWCIGRNMYSNYRYMQSKGHNRAFYFVFDENQPKDSEYRAVVIHAYESGKWARTTANNNGDFPYGGGRWVELGEGFKTIEGKKLWEKIKGLNDLFPFINPKSHELRRLGFKGKKLTLEAFTELDNESKVDWLRINASDRNIVNTDIVKSLQPFGDISKNDLINHDRVFSYNELKGNVGLLKRYAIYRFTRYPDKPIPYHFIPYLIEPNKPDPLHLQKYYFEKFEESYLTYEIIEKYFHIDILKQFIKNQINIKSYLPKGAIEYMEDKDKQMFEIYSISYSDIEIYNGNIDEDSTEAPIQNAQVSIISTDSFLNYPKENASKFIKLLCNTKIKENDVFLLGTPIIFEIRSEIYGIFKSSKDLSDTYYDLINLQTYNVYKKLIKTDNGEIFYKNKKPINFSPFINKQTGKNSYIITEKDFDSVLIDNKIVESIKILLYK